MSKNIPLIAAREVSDMAAFAQLLCDCALLLHRRYFRCAASLRLPIKQNASGRLRYLKQHAQVALPIRILVSAIQPLFIVKLKPSLTLELVLFIADRDCIAVLAGCGESTALFICSAIGIIPLAGWMGRATEALAREWAKEPADY